MINRPRVVNRGLHLDVEVAVVIDDRNLGYSSETKFNSQNTGCTSLADSNSSSQTTTFREMDARALLGASECRVCQTATVAGSKKRLTRCFRELKVASQQQTPPAKSLDI